MDIICLAIVVTLFAGARLMVTLLGSLEGGA